jgi:hypothetical protein
MRLFAGNGSTVNADVRSTCTGRTPWSDAGPGAGRIVFEGTPAELVAARSTLTGEHLAACVGSSRRLSRRAERA